MADPITEFCKQVSGGIEQASFAQKRMLVELLIDCVVVTNEEVEIRYVVPTSANGAPAALLSFAYRLSKKCISTIMKESPMGSAG